jgi:hypothetical protein
LNTVRICSTVPMASTTSYSKTSPGFIAKVCRGAA